MPIKNLFKILCLAAVISSCGEKTIKERTSELVPNPEGEQKDQPGIVENIKQSYMTGYYVGRFEASKINDQSRAKEENKINLSIDSVKNETIFGHSVVAGNIRPFSGKIVQLTDTLFEVKASEPGDDKYDGVFEFTLDSRWGYIRGTWKANNTNLAVPERKYVLMEKKFKYEPNNMIAAEHITVYGSETDNSAEAFTEDAGKFNASTTLLKSSDIENMYQRDLQATRNAIYARHGYSFKNREMRDFFDNIDWYIPVSVNVTNELTELEEKNIALLKRYEKHAEKYYDEYGR